MNKINLFHISPENIREMEDLHRLKETEVLVLLLGSGADVYNEIIALANEKVTNRQLLFKSTDSFIIACPPAAAVEVLASTAVDELYRANVHVYNITRKLLSAMHASQEDLKMMLSLLRPSFYVPIAGEYQDMLANAKIAIASGGRHSHANVFLLDNGMVIDLYQKKAKILPDLLPTGYLLVDGLGVGDVGSDVIAERQALSQDGIVVMGVSVSLKQKKIVAGPDVQMRGFVFLKEADSILKHVINIFVSEVSGAISEPKCSLPKLCEQIKDKCFYQIRRETGRLPLVVPLVEVVDD
jgi:ribonuclease J